MILKRLNSVKSEESPLHFLRTAGNITNAAASEMKRNKIWQQWFIAHRCLGKTEWIRRYESMLEWRKKYNTVGMDWNALKYAESEWKRNSCRGCRMHSCRCIIYPTLYRLVSSALHSSDNSVDDPIRHPHKWFPTILQTVTIGDYMITHLAAFGWVWPCAS